jgi:hypothetical protein
MRFLRQCKVPREEVMFVTIHRGNIRPSKKEMNKAVTMLKLPMFVGRLRITTSLYRWPIGSLPSTCMVLHTALRTFIPRRDQLVICGYYFGDISLHKSQQYELHRNAMDYSAMTDFWVVGDKPITKNVDLLLCQLRNHQLPIEDSVRYNGPVLCVHVKERTHRSCTACEQLSVTCGLWTRTARVLYANTEAKFPQEQLTSKEMLQYLQLWHGRVFSFAFLVSARAFAPRVRVRARVNPCRIYGGQSGTGTGFSLRSSVLPCQYHSTVVLQTHISSGRWTICPLVTAVQRRNLTP